VLLFSGAAQVDWDTRNDVERADRIDEPHEGFARLIGS
jgi:hypothetical protein